MRKNIIILILLTIFCLSVSISSVSANENLTNDIVCNDAGNILSSDTQENLEIESDHAHLEQQENKNPRLSSNSEEVLSVDKNTEKLSYDNSYSPDNVIDLLVSYDEEFFKADDVKIRDIQLKDDNHKNLHGYVDIYVDGKYYKRLNINHDKETLNLGKLKVGKHTIKVQVKEGYYVECKISVVNPLSKTSTSKTTVKAPTVTAYYKASKYFKVTVKKNGKPVKNLKLKVKVYTGSKYKTYTIKTNKNGVAKLSTKKFKVGSHKVKITSTNKKYKISKTSKIIIKKKVSYTTFKSPSGYTWKIKTTTWNKMKKEAVNNYKFFRSVGSYHPGYSDSSVTVKLTKNGHTYTGTAYAVQNSNYMRCEIRGAVNGVYISDKGDTYV